MDTFNDQMFEQKLLKLKDTHDSIANLSSWCLTNQQHHDKIVATWLTILKRVKIEQRVILFYLANDVVQYSKKKSLPFVDSFAPAFQKAVTMVREDLIRPKIERLFSIWKQRGIYDENYLSDLNGLLARDKSSRIDISEFQPSVLYSRLRSCKELEDDTDMKLKILTHSHMSLTDIEKMRKSLKDRDSGTDLIPEVEEGLNKIKSYISALEAEIKERVGLIDLLDISEIYYADQLKEAKVVVNAYRCFSGRIKGVKRKLEEQIKELPSPPLSPDVNAPSPSPSPSPDKTIFNDVSFYGMNLSSGGSFMDGSLITNNYLAKAFDDETSLPAVPSPSCFNPSLTTVAASENTASTQISNLPVESPVNRTMNSHSPTVNCFSTFTVNNAPGTTVQFSGPLPVSPNASRLQPPVDQSTTSGSSINHTPISAHPPALPTTFTPPHMTGSNSIGSNYTPPPMVPQIQNHVGPHQMPLNSDTVSCSVQSSDNAFNNVAVPNNNTETTEGNKIEVVTRTQNLNDQNMTLSALLQSLLPRSSSKTSGLNSNNNNETIASIIQSTPRSPSPDPVPHTLPPKFPVWSDPPRDNWESPESPPSYEKAGYNLAEDVDMRSVFDEDIAAGDESMGKDVDHRNLISLTGSTDTDYRSLAAIGTSAMCQDNVENIDMDLSDEDEKKTEGINCTADKLMQKTSYIPPPPIPPLATIQQPPPVLPPHVSFHPPPRVPHNVSLETSPPLSSPSSALQTVEVITTNNVARQADLTIPPPSSFSPTIPPPVSDEEVSLTPRRNRMPVSVNFYSNKVPPPLPPLPPPPPPPLPPHNHWNTSPSSHLHFPPPYIVDHHHRTPNPITRHHHHQSFKALRPPHYQRVSHFPRW